MSNEEILLEKFGDAPISLAMIVSTLMKPQSKAEIIVG